LECDICRESFEITRRRMARLPFVPECSMI
jgi:hypothetical protein